MRAERVRLWRERRRRVKAGLLAQADVDAREVGMEVPEPKLDQHDGAVSGTLLQDRFEVLHDPIIHNPFMLGLLCYIFGCSSKDNIETRIRKLMRMGAEIERGFVARGGPPPATAKNTAMTTRP